MLEAACEREQDFEICRRAVAAKKMPEPDLPSVPAVCPAGRGAPPTTVLTVTLPGAFVDGVKIKPQPGDVAEAVAGAGPLALVVDDRVTVAQLWPLLQGAAAANRDELSLAVRVGDDAVPLRLGPFADEAQIVASPGDPIEALARAVAEACPAPSIALAQDEPDGP